MTLEQTFQAEAIRQATTALEQFHCPTKRLLNQLQTRGGVETARDLTNRRRLSDGFDALQQCGHLELTLEALMTRGKYGFLFTDEQVNWCLQVLVESGYYG